MKHERDPILIAEPELRWPIVMVAFAVTAIVALIGGGVYYATRQPRAPSAEPQLEQTLRPGQPEFDQFSGQIVVERLASTEKLHDFNRPAVEMSASVRNRTGRTLTGLELRAAILDSHRSTVRERTVVIIPARQALLEPDEAINVRILLEDVDRNRERAELRLKVTGMRFS